jgi:hypothetical protein
MTTITTVCVNAVIRSVYILRAGITATLMRSAKTSQQRRDANARDFDQVASVESANPSHVASQENGMPATYTYNDAIENAKSVVVKAWEEVFTGKDDAHMKLILSIVGRLDALKRPSRRKRSRVQFTEKR